MKTLQQLCPEIGTEQLRLIWREVEALLGTDVLPDNAEIGDVIQFGFQIGVRDEVKTKLQEFIGGNNDQL